MFAFLYFVFPTPWRESRVAERTTRVNWITGVEQISSPSGWVSPAKPSEAIEVSDLHYEMGAYNDAKLICKFHNRSDQEMIGVTVQFSLLNEVGEVVATDSAGGTYGENVKPGDTVVYSDRSSVTARVKDPTACKLRVDLVLGRSRP